MSKLIGYFMIGLVFILMISTEIFSQFTPPPPPPMPMNQPMYFAPIPNSYTFQVYLKDGNTVKGESRMHSTWKNTYVTIDDRKIYPSETDSIESNFMIGYPEGDKYWYFKNSDGKISTYNKTPYQNDWGFDFIEKENSGLTEYSLNNLENFVSDNQKALDQINQYKTGRIVKYSMLVGGGIMTLGGFFSLDKGENKSFSETKGSSFIIGGLVVMVASWIPHLIVKDKPKKAFNIYNTEY